MRDVLELAQTIAIVIIGGGLIYLVVLIRRAIAELRGISAGGDSAGNSTRLDSQPGRRQSR